MAARTVLSAAASSFRRPVPEAKIVPRRGFSAGGDHHGSPKINLWDDPLSPSKWKEEHFVLASLSGWGLIFYSGYKFFGGGKKEEVPAEPKH